MTEEVSWETLALVDGALEGFAPSPVHILEVDNGERELLQENPETLIPGSSHARSFSDFGRRLGWGRLVLEHGISTDAGRFDRLRRLVLVTTDWDTCPATDMGFESNLPARAWGSRC